MRSVNKIILIGNVGSDPEVRYTNNETAVASFSLATNMKYKKADGELVEKTDWHRVKAWSKLAEIIGEYVRKGDALYIEGRIEYGSYEDNEGITRYTTDIVVQQLNMLSSKNGSSNGNGKAQSSDENEAPRSKRSSKEKAKTSSAPRKRRKVTPKAAPVVEDGDDDVPADDELDF